MHLATAEWQYLDLITERAKSVEWCFLIGTLIHTCTLQMLMEQKSACDSMIDEKNKLIHDFQQVCELVSNLLVIHLNNNIVDKIGYSLQTIKNVIET